ncbi:MAG: hypothetical protein JXR03_01090 [Cyclobacteriaceae bacterium]
MKTIICLIALLTIGLLISCSDDPVNNPKVNINELIFNEDTYQLKNGLVNDFGSSDITESGEDTHIYHQFQITDADFIFEFNSYVPKPGHKAFIEIDMFAPGKTEFTDGLFSFVDLPNQTDKSSLRGEYFFDEMVTTLVNPDGSSKWQAVDGFIKVTENPRTEDTDDPNYTVRVKVNAQMLDQNNSPIPSSEQEISFTFTSTFICNYVE